MLHAATQGSLHACMHASWHVQTWVLVHPEAHSSVMRAWTEPTPERQPAPVHWISTHEPQPCWCRPCSKGLAGLRPATR